MELQLSDHFDKMGPLLIAVTALLLAMVPPTASQGCRFRINGDLGQPQPVYIYNNRFLMPNGRSGQIRVNAGQQILIACPGSTIRHPNAIGNVATATARCVNGNQISGAGWLRANGAFGALTCAREPTISAQATQDRCFGGNTVIRVGYVVDNVFHTWYHSCFDRNNMEVLYVWYDQTAQYSVHQIRVERPAWMDGGFYPRVNVNRQYVLNVQRETIGRIVGNNVVNRYITNDQFLSRGHLAAKSDFPYASAQLATFYFINAAPQWQSFNAGNWGDLELALRARIAEANYNAVIYTGTFGSLQLRDSHNRWQDIFLYRNGNTRRVPAPLYFYKVAYDAGRRVGTAFIGVNNPFLTAAEARRKQFCTDRCRNNRAFAWLNWQPDNINLGYSFCCTLADFKAFVPHLQTLPAFGADRLLS